MKKPNEMSKEELLKQLEKLNRALGHLSHKGTWLSDDVLEKIWFAKTEEEAIKIAEYFRETVHKMLKGKVEHCLWAGDRIKEEK